MASADTTWREVVYGEIVFECKNLATLEKGGPLMQELIPVHIGAQNGVLVGDKSHSHRALVFVVYKVAHCALHIYKLHIGVGAYALHQLVDNGICELVIYSHKGLVGHNKAHRAACLPRAKVRREHYRTAVAYLLTHLLGICYLHSVRKRLVAHARLADHIYNLLCEVAVCATANLAQLLLALVGERPAQVIHYDTTAIAQHVTQQKIAY